MELNLYISSIIQFFKKNVFSISLLIENSKKTSLEKKEKEEYR